MTDRSKNLSRIHSLLLRRATEGLDAVDEIALRALLAAHPEVDEYQYERAAAAVLLASLEVIDPMPADVKRRLAGRWDRSRG
jgi:hypothetical protein